MSVLRGVCLVVLGFGLLLAGAIACGSHDQGDIIAFCELATDGVGTHLVRSTEDLAQLDALEASAPPDIRAAAITIANASREVGEIDDLQELFRRAFDLEQAVAQARLDMLTYTQHRCF
ncbi:MAG: hypothetical protein F4X48_05260 [Acidimicrobiia bacterium]|nr:hypothetical protein [Acidimicrobiia bacterium]MYC57974.1 hypothetical protein [Acidimicrobiia bacterium]MYI31077.1 hypothetical protein [Acidimicrobiia bacterium]